MQKLLIYFTAIFFTTFFSQKIFAQEIIVGDISAKSEVNTKIQGNGNVQTNIEVEANGIKKTLSASGSGEYKLEITNVSPLPTIKIKPTEAIVKKVTPKIYQNTTYLSKIQSIFKNFLQSFRSIFNF